MAKKTVWVCACCGKHGDTRDALGDSSCRSHAVECYADSAEYEGFRVTKARAVMRVVEGDKTPSPAQ